MATLGHLVVGLAAGRFYADRCAGGVLVPSLVFAGLSMAPDADIIAFVMRIPYEAEWGHRGASHALLLGFFGGALVGGFWAWLRAWRRLPARPALAAALGAMAMASHGLLDALTDGGLGVALVWPFSLERWFAPWRPLPVAPIGAHFLSGEGLRCVLVEALWFSPLWVWALRPARRS